MLVNGEFERLRHLNGKDGFKTGEVSLCYSNVERPHRLQQALEDLFRDAESRVDAGCNVLIVTDRGATRDDLVIPVLLAVSA